MASVAAIVFFLSLIEPVMDDKLTAPVKAITYQE